ncbi:MAG: anti sigma factor C-terminal domain-containing protein [Sporolactobacillus sp.]
MIEWTKDKEKRILFKYRLTLTLRIFRVLLACFLLYAGYVMILNILFAHSYMIKQNIFNSELALDWTQPNLQETTDIDQKMTPLLTQKASYSVTRTIGTRAYIAGKVEMNKTLFTPFSHLQVKWNDQASQAEHYVFSLPENPKTGKKFSSSTGDTEAWQVLRKVDSGTVADLSFSTTRYLSPEALIRMLKPYDLHVLWMPLYTGELKDFDSGYGESANTLSVPNFGLAGGRGMDRNGSWKDNSLTGLTLKNSKKSMLTNMKRLIDDKSQTYNETFLGLTYLPKRYHYLQTHGFQVYGAVVTGPSKELLKLQKLKIIRQPQIGDVEFWNWEND